MARKLRTVSQGELNELSTEWGIISMERQRVRSCGALKAAAAISRALKSLDGAIRHAQRALNMEEQ